MKRPGLVIALVLLLGAGLLVMPGVLMLMAFTGGRSEVASGGACNHDVTVARGSMTADQLGPAQLANAATVVSVGKAMNVPPRGVLIALAAAHQESRFRNYANDGGGRDLQPDQAGISQSLSLPHDAVGIDHGSLGIFQQQWPWWGSMPELMDPATSARKFYERLLGVPGWQEMSVTAAAQAVQRSAFPDAYADDEAVATELLSLSEVSGSPIRSAAWTAGAGGDPCLAPAEFSGTVASPLGPSARFADLHNFGGTGPRWSRGHTGTDLSAPCGTPVLAAHDGAVIVETDQAWSGKWLLKVSTGPGRLTTWYAHMQGLTVTHGQVVRAGQQIGVIGSLGNSTGCHLHLEVHPHGGSIYEDAIDPSKWLEDQLSTDIEQVVADSTASPDHIVATFNVLGHSHTKPGGNKPGWASSQQRMKWAVEVLDKYGVGVVGFQEFEPVQKRTFLDLAGDRYAVHSPRGETANSIAWHRGRWALVSANRFPVPYFNGDLEPMPIVRLRDQVTGQDSIFINVHNPADTKRFHNQSRFRRDAVRRELAAVQSLAAHYGLPVYLTGDLNERANVFCALTANGTLTAAAGGSNDGTCRPPMYEGIDWILGTRAAWRGHGVVRDGIVGRVSDHPLVLARVSGAAVNEGGGGE